MKRFFIHTVLCVSKKDPFEMGLWLSVKNGNRNDRIRNGNDRNRKWPRNFPYKLKFLAILCRKKEAHFRFRSFPFPSSRFPFFKPIFHLATLFVRREAKTRIWQRDWLELPGEKIRREQVGTVPTFLSVRASKFAKWKIGFRGCSYEPALPS